MEAKLWEMMGGILQGEHGKEWMRNCEKGWGYTADRVTVERDGDILQNEYCRMSKCTWERMNEKL